MLSSSVSSLLLYLICVQKLIKNSYSEDGNGIMKEDMVLEEDGLTSEVIGDKDGGNKPTRVVRHQSRQLCLIKMRSWR